jgi:hypothetical protein
MTVQRTGQTTDDRRWIADFGLRIWEGMEHGLSGETGETRGLARGGEEQFLSFQT